MNTLVVHFSMFGNTRKIADAVAEVLKSEGAVRSLHADRLSLADLQQADLVVMGTPTHNMNLPKAVRPVLEALPKRALHGVWVAAFDTSYKLSWWLNHFTAAKRLIRKLRKLGGVRVLPPETFHVEGREGPLFNGELERARNWAGLILQEVESDNT